MQTNQRMVRGIRLPMRAHRGNDRIKHGFLVPAATWVLIFTLFPLLFALYTMMYSFRFGRFNQFVYANNLTRMLVDDNLHNALRVTLKFIMLAVPIEMVLGFGLAILLDREIRGKHILRTLMIMPLFATPVAIGYLGITFYYERHGPINVLIHALGGAEIPWLSHPIWALISIVLIDIWQWTPFVFLISLAALQGIPLDLYEAAQVDGSSAFQRFRYLTLPLMVPTLWLILLLRLVECLKVLEIPTTLTRGGPARATEVYSLFTYRTALGFFDLGYATAQGFLLLAIALLMIAVIFSRIRQLYQPESRDL
jgi:multiple sugar transport system permease protein